MSMLKKHFNRITHLKKSTKKKKSNDIMIDGEN